VRKRRREISSLKGVANCYVGASTNRYRSNVPVQRELCQHERRRHTLTTRTQLKGWLFASSLFCSFACVQLAHAAHPSSTLPKASAEGVKPVAKKNSRPTAQPLQLTPPTFRAPQRQEKLILGLRLPTFIAFGLGGLSAGGALATSYAATRGNDPSSCDSRCTEKGVRQKALLVTTGVLTGMAAAGVGIGITLMLKAPKNPRRDAIRPRFDLGLSGEKAVAKVGWVFNSF
jgi:hypothetical protein